MGKDRAVLLMAERETEHSAQIRLQLAEIRVEAVAADLPGVQIPIRRLDDLRRLLLGGRARHHGEHLSGQHHPDAFFGNALALAAMIVIITVKPAAVAAVDPLRPADMFPDPLRLFPQALLHYAAVELHFPARYIVEAALTVVVQHLPLARRVLVHRAVHQE